jgi:hypothetical protein
VSLWLTGEAAWFALPGRAEEFDLPLATPLADLLGGVLAQGSVTLCSQCAARRGIGEDDVRPAFPNQPGRRLRQIHLAAS